MRLCSLSKIIFSTLILYLLCGNLLAQPWSYTVTNSNHTIILLNDSSNYTINGLAIETGDVIGVFYTDSTGSLACGGYFSWYDFSPINASMAAFGAFGIDNGFNQGEKFEWKIWQASTNTVFNAEATYNTALPDSAYFNDNGLSLLTSLNGSSQASPGPWSYIVTNSSHLIILLNDANNYLIDNQPIQPGDFMGVFFEDSQGELQCGGYFEWYYFAPNNEALSAFGAFQADDGFMSGEEFQWKVWRAADSTELDAVATYNPLLPDQENYSDNGISLLGSLNATSVCNAPVVTGHPANFTCCEGEPHTFSLTATGTSPLTYTWIKDGTDTVSVGKFFTIDPVSIDAAGDYSCIVSNACGSDTSNIAVLTVKPSPDVTITGTSSVCEGMTATLDAGVFPTYNWSNGASIQSIVVSASGNYLVTVTASNGCEDVDSVQFTVNQNPMVNLGNDTAICDGETLEIDAGVYSTYNWSNGASTKSIIVSAAGSYSVTVTNSNGCQGGDTIALSINQNPVVNLGNDTAICQGEVLLLDASVFNSYSWSNGAGTQTISVAVADSYSVTVSDNNTCTGSDTLVLSINPSPVADLGNDTLICQGENLTLDAGIFSSYLWSNSSTIQTISVSTAGNYSVTVTDGNGCEDSDTILLSINQNPIVDLGKDTAICEGESLLLDAGVFDSYNWLNGTSDQTLTVSSGGNYSVTVTDNNGCQDVDSILLSINQNPFVDLGNDTTLCLGETLFLEAGNFSSYSWSTGVSTQTINVASGGTYSVIAIDLNGCEGRDTIQLTDVQNPIVDIGNDTAFCQGGILILDAGTFHSYLWSTSETTQSISVSTDGNFSVTITDTNGCEDSDTLQLTVYQNPVLDLGNDTSICIGQSVILDADSYNSYIWSTSASTQSITASTTGSYSVTVEDSNGCVGSDIMELSVAQNLVVDLGNDTSICDGESLLLDAGVFHTYDWSTGASTQTINVLTTGTYSLSVTDASGCEGADTILITVNQNPVLDLPNDTSICDGEILNIDAGTFDSYTWSTGAGTQAISVSVTGDYSVTVSDINACTDRDTISVSVKKIISIQPPQLYSDQSESFNITCEYTNFTTTQATIWMSKDANNIFASSIQINSDLNLDAEFSTTCNTPIGNWRMNMEISPTCTLSYDYIEVIPETIPPNALCKDTSLYLNASGQGSLTAIEIDNGSSDACNIASRTLDKTAFACTDVGLNTIILTITDNNNNSSTCPANVTVIDTINPVAICHDTTLSLNALGQVSVTAVEIDNGSSDNCGIASLSLNKTNFGCIDLGVNTLTLTVIDVNGNSSTCTSSVTVVDNFTPISISSQPQGSAYCLQENVLLEVVATGSTTLLYQWNKDGSPIIGADSSSLQLNNLAYSDAGIYTCDITQVCSTVSSDPATIVVNSCLDVCGTIASNTTWNVDTVRVSCEVNVPDDVTLTVAPGTVVEFQGHYKLNVFGSLLAQGTINDSIKFTAANSSTGWHGIRIDNSSLGANGAMNDNDSTILEYCIMEYGKATGSSPNSQGGAVYINSFDKVRLSNSCFSHNSANSIGGALYMNASSPVIKNNIFSHNNSGANGGAMFFLSCTPIFSNNIISNNSASNTGGGLYLNSSSPAVSNSTFANNTANFAGGVYLQSSSPLIKNTIVWGNNGGGANQLFWDSPSNPSVDYCNVENGTDFGGTGSYSNNIDSDPLFANPTTSAGVNGVTGDGLAEDWELTKCSASINTGTPSIAGLNLGPVDLAGFPRIQHGIVDMGALEFQGVFYALPVTTCPATQNVCINGGPVDLTSIGATPAGGEFTWTGGSGNSFDPVAAGAGNHTINYEVTNLNNCTDDCDFTIHVYNAFTAGDILTTGETICYGGDPSLIGSSTTASGGDESISYQWQSSTDNFVSAPTDITGSNSASYDPPANLTATTWYRRQAKDGTCNTAWETSSGVWKVTVYDDFTAGAIPTTGETICYDGDPSSIGSSTDASGGDGTITYQWQSSTDNFATTPTDIGSSNSASYDPPANLTATTWYRRQAKDGTCNTAWEISSGVWKVTVYDDFTAGAILTIGETICYGGNPVLIGSSTTASGGDESISYQWQSSTDNFVSAPTDITGSNSASYDPPANLTATTWYRRQAKDGTCNTAWETSSGVWKVTVYDDFTAGDILTTGETICYGGDPSLIGSSTAASGGDESISYQWQSSTDNFVSTPTDLVGSNSVSYDPPANLIETTWYRRQAVDATCNTAWETSTGVWKVSVDPIPTAGIISNAPICTGENLTLRGMYEPVLCESNCNVPLNYCASGSNLPFYQYISEVKLADSINSSSYSGYSDNTSGLFQILYLDSTYALSVEINNYFNYLHTTNCYIDWNRDGDFDDPGEKTELGSGMGSQQLNGMISVPANAILGQTMMRVVNRQTFDAPACGSYPIGETEDYLLEIRGMDTQSIISYEWSGPAGSSTAQNWTIVGASPEESGTYNLTVTNTYNCSDVASVQAQVLNPQPDLGADTLYSMFPDTLQFDPGLFDSYQWNTGATTQQISGENYGSYKVTVSQLQCTAEDSVWVGEIQNIGLREGWGIFSTYINTALEMHELFTDFATKPIIVKNDAGQVYWDIIGVDEIGALSMHKGYMIKMANADELIVYGDAYAETSPVSLDQGYNIVSYLRKYAAPVDEIFSDVVNHLALVKDQDGMAYWPIFQVNLIGDMENGQGYVVKMIQADTLIYPSNSTLFAKNSIMIESPEHYSRAMNTGENMTLGIPLEAWDVLPENGDEVAVFTRDGDLIGSTVFQGSHMALPVWSKDLLDQQSKGLSEAEAFDIYIYHQASGEQEKLEVIEWLEGDGTYTRNGVAVVGKLIRDGQANDLSGLEAEAYPNPFRNEFEIVITLPESSNISVSLYDVLGRKMEELFSGSYNKGRHQIRYDAARLTAGSYYLRVESNTESKLIKLTKFD